jgi:hypothetical protein
MVSCQLLQLETQLQSQDHPRGILADKVILLQVTLQALPFSPFTFHLRMLCTYLSSGAGKMSSLQATLPKGSNSTPTSTELWSYQLPWSPTM